MNERENEISETTISGQTDQLIEMPAALIDASQPQVAKRRAYRVFLLLPLIFLTVSLFGGLRFSSADGSFIFLKPPLVCLIFAAMLMIVFARARLIEIGRWFSEESSFIENLAAGIVLLSLFAASTQVFNALLPEQGLPFWVVAFCFFWTLWNNAFAEFDARRLMKSLSAMFALAFVAKYLVLLNLATPAGQGWIESLMQNPSKAAATWLLDIPQLSAATGYLQFFVLGLYMAGLYMLPPKIHSQSGKSHEMIKAQESRS